MRKTATRGWLLLIIGLLAVAVPTTDLSAEPANDGYAGTNIGDPPFGPGEDANDPEEPFDEVACTAHVQAGSSVDGMLGVSGEVWVMLWTAGLTLLRGAM
jgi:hypothetical protein